VAALLAVAAGDPAIAAADDAPRWLAGAGWWGLKGRDSSAAVVDLEHRFAPVWRGVFPLVGGLATSDGAWHVRAGLGRDVALGERWVVTISSAAGWFDPGDGDDLGHDVEFRSALDVAYRLREDLRIGLAVAHLSNASLAEDNPGVETLSLVVSWRR
jgi:hypothetical protein